MKPAAYKLIEVFNEAKALPAGAEREQFIAQACLGNAELREQVLSLLQADDEAGDFLKRTAILETSAVITEKPGSKIGRYKLLQQLGEGGCGVVYMAEQEEPVRRRVALKVIKLGMDTKQVIARFEAERQALALMDHPHIAKVLDAGATETGRPFFVMELVQGIKITEYCDQKNLSTRERLALFIQVCQAIQHAHQKGVIHRDIKPSNILVTQHDNMSIPKVIDFGIAKATADQRLTDKTLFTAFEQFIGTPAYMSPEQAQLSGLDIDTRTDIYSLGVLLYELLTGKTPFDAEKLLASGLDEIRRIIRETEPPRPSTSLSTLNDADLSTVAARRHVEPPGLLHLIRGDLDWIVMKCLEKDRGRRYETANGLAVDLQRHLNSEPVLACPPSAVYRFRKFARRNRAAILTATVVTSALLLTVAALTVSTVRIAREQRTTATSLQAETLAKGNLEQTLERQRLDLYFHCITLAHRELLADNLGRALQLLEDCPKDLRAWEWDYLMRLSRVEPRVLQSGSGVQGVAFHPSGGQVAGACADGTVKLINVATGKLEQTLEGHGSFVFSVAFSPDGQRLASASADRTIRLWDVASETELYQWPGHRGEAGMANAVAYSPDGRLVVAGGEDGIATIWSAADGREVHRLQHESTAVCADFSSDSRIVATGTWGGVVRIWDPQTGLLLRKLAAHSHRISAISFSADGQWLATASFDRTIKIWDFATGELVRTLRGHHGLLSGLEFSRDGRRLFSSGGEDKTVKVWDLDASRVDASREVLNLRGHAIFCHGLAASADGLHLASTGEDGTIRLWDASPLKGDEGQESSTYQHDSEVWSVTFSADGRHLASGSWDGTVRLWDARNGALLRKVGRANGETIVFHVSFSPDGKKLAAASRTREGVASVRVWETETGRDVFEEIQDRNSAPFAVTFHPSGQHLVRAGAEHTVQVRDARDGKEVGIVGRHDRQIWAMSFSPPDGRRLATASSDRTVRIWAWDPARLEEPREPEVTLRVHVAGYGDRVAFSPDGRLLATGGDGFAANIWDASTGMLQQVLSGHTGDVFALAFSPDGRWLATAGEDSTIRIWDARSWKALHTLRGHTGIIMSLAFSPDSHRLASGSRDHTLKLWDTIPWDEIR